MKQSLRKRIVGMLAASVSLTSLLAYADEEQVTFYPTYGYKEGDAWNIPMRIWVHEKPDRIRRAVAKVARDKIAERAGITILSQAQKDLFMARARGFVEDSESGESVVFQFDKDPDNKEYRLGNRKGAFKTDRNGLLESTLMLGDETVKRLLRAQASEQGWLTYRAVSDEHVGTGQVRLIPPEGRSVISDIDDTIKITEIPAGEKAVLSNTFFRDFAAVPGMAEMYRAFGNDVAFHYVSGSPWQLYGPLAEFLFDERANFPRGSFHMKNVRTNPFESETYQDLWALIVGKSRNATFNQKIAQITMLMAHFPKRTFILIGDSGERDPEIFRKIRETFPDQVEEIRIRDVVNAADNPPDRLEGMTVIPVDMNAGES